MRGHMKGGGRWAATARSRVVPRCAARVAEKGLLLARAAHWAAPAGLALCAAATVDWCDSMPPCDNLVRMTRLSKQKSGASKPRKPHVSRSRSGYWLLQDAKARFSELVRKVRSEGPQHVTVHGRRSEEHTSELQSRVDLVCRLLLEKKKIEKKNSS